jgi:hypothetical protein
MSDIDLIVTQITSPTEIPYGLSLDDVAAMLKYPWLNITGPPPTAVVLQSVFKDGALIVLTPSDDTFTPGAPPPAEAYGIVNIDEQNVLWARRIEYDTGGMDPSDLIDQLLGEIETYGREHEARRMVYSGGSPVVSDALRERGFADGPNGRPGLWVEILPTPTH